VIFTQAGKIRAGVPAQQGPQGNDQAPLTQIAAGQQCAGPPRLGSEPQIREAHLPALPDTPKEEEVTPHLVENPSAPRLALPEISFTLLTKFI